MAVARRGGGGGGAGGGGAAPAPPGPSREVRDELLRLLVPGVEQEDHLEGLLGGGQIVLAVGDLAEDLVGDDVVRGGLGDLLHLGRRLGVLLLLEIGAAEGDAAPEVVGVDLQPLEGDLDRVVEEARLAVGLRERSEDPGVRVLGEDIEILPDLRRGRSRVPLLVGRHRKRSWLRLPPADAATGLTVTVTAGDDTVAVGFSVTPRRAL